MALMDGKRGLVVGIANEHSMAYSIAESLLAHGATCMFTHLPGDKMERRLRKAMDSLGVPDAWTTSLDAASDEDLDRVFAKVAADVG
jgi:enoyl-[acyl-carrier protein] reductase I